jgi:hypothetical protein
VDAVLRPVAPVPHKSSARLADAPALVVSARNKAADLYVAAPVVLVAGSAVPQWSGVLEGIAHIEYCCLLPHGSPIRFYSQDLQLQLLVEELDLHLDLEEHRRRKDLPC